MSMSDEMNWQRDRALGQTHPKKAKTDDETVRARGEIMDESVNDE